MTSSKSVQIALEPLGRTIAVAPGTALQDVLFTHGVEFPCGGNGRCRACRVKVLRGHVPVTPAQSRALKPAELAAGWRLACLVTAESDLTLDLAQWETVILADDTRFEFTPREGLGVAVDLGTTTLVAQLVELGSGRVLAVRHTLNPQARYGADIMSRVSFGLQADQGEILRDLIRVEILGLIQGLLADTVPSGGKLLRDVVIVGNTVMHHLFCGLKLDKLAHYPFEPEQDGLAVFHPRELGWDGLGAAAVSFLPCLGGFVGSDLLAGVLATGLAASTEVRGLVDLGTNGEIVLGSRAGLLCASTAAGPAFEGARIAQGMRAATGAICAVSVADGQFQCKVLGGGPPRGICGSGLVDAAAAALELSLLTASGRLANGTQALPLCPEVLITQKDIRELQLAKGAIAAGLKIMLEQLRATPQDLKGLYLAGAFGNYINRASARRIGLLDFPPELVQASGNTALLGAKLALFIASEERHFTSLRRLIRHVPLSSDPHFQDIYAEEMVFT